MSKKTVWAIGGAGIIFVLLSILMLSYGNIKIAGISWIAFLAMSLAIPIGVRASYNVSTRNLVISYGLASGAMITSAAIFLVPSAIQYAPVYGGLGIAAGIMAGFAIHTLNHSLTHHSYEWSPIILELWFHGMTAGVVIGLVYAAMPTLGLLLGVAIVSHKAPAGYAAARRLAMQKKSPALLLLPALAVGLLAMPISLIKLGNNSILEGLIFGFATGIFFHVAIDFLPECEVGGEIHQHTELDSDEHHNLDRYRKWAVGSTFTGGAVVFLVWYIFY